MAQEKDPALASKNQLTMLDFYEIDYTLSETPFHIRFYEQ